MHCNFYINLLKLKSKNIDQFSFTRHIHSETLLWITKCTRGVSLMAKKKNLFKGFTTLKENSLLTLLRKHFTVEANQKVFEWRASVIRVLQPAQSDSPCARLKRIPLWVCFPYQRAAENRALRRTALLCIITSHCASSFVTPRLKSSSDKCLVSPRPRHL